MTIGGISLCDTSFESYWKALWFVLRICWWFCIFEDVMDWKLKILLNFAFQGFSMINTDYLSFLHERVPNCLHFIFWSQFWNINHECIMDRFCHFSSLTWPICCGFLLTLYQISSLNWLIIGHVMQILRFSIIRVMTGPLLSTISKHNALMLSELQTDINPWLLVGLSCVIHQWKGLLNQNQVNQVSSLNLKSESLHLPLANSISS